MSNATITLSYRADLSRDILPTPMRGLLATGDQRAHRVAVEVLRDGAPVDLTGMTVTGGFLRADDSMVLLTGSVSGGKAVMTLPQACYRVAGPFALVIRLTSGTDIVTVFYGQGAVTRADADTAVDPDKRIPSLEELLAQITRMEQATSAAQTATASATAAASKAQTAATEATAATAKTNTAAAAANTVAGEAHTAAGEAQAAAGEAQAAASAATAAAATVNAARDAAHAAATEAQTAAGEAQTAAGEASEAARQAAVEAGSAGAAATAAHEAAARATDAAITAERWGSVAVTVTMGEADAPPLCTVTDTDTGKAMAFALPRGLTGLTPNLTVGEVLTGEPGTAAQAWITGDAEAPLLHLRLPRGDVGSIEALTVCGVGPDGSGNVPLTPEALGALPEGGVAEAAGRLAQARSIALSGQVTGSASFDGAGDVTIAATLADCGPGAGSCGPTANASPGYGGSFTVPQITLDAKGRVTAATGRTVTLPAQNLLAAYPVGAVYISLNATSPASLFGGTWTAISGRFLIAANSAYAAGATGGAATITLSTANMPSHSHLVPTYGNNTTANQAELCAIDAGAWYKTAYYKGAVTTAAGSGAAFSNLPPYYAAYMWRRTA